MTTVQLPKEIGHFINGQFTSSRSQKTFVNLAPASGMSCAEIPLGDADDIEQAVLSAQTAFPAWSKLSLPERCHYLKKIGDLILERQEYFARIEALDTGKPLSETLHGDIPRAASNFHFFADLAPRQPEPNFISSTDHSHHRASRHPLGVVGLITPWNLPLYLATWKIAPALAQGNTVILKPAELTPLSATALAEICRDAGLPDGVFNVVHGFGAQSAGDALVRHPGVKAISFTGETTTGVAITQAAAPHLKKLSFELGGKGASLICSDADLELASATSARAAFRNQGQICLAGSRLLVDENVADEVLEHMQQHVKDIRIGDPLDLNTTMGSLISTEHRDKVRSYISYANETPGHTILYGGEIPPGFEKGAYLEPTIILVTDQQSRLIQEEIFGPVLTVQTFKTEEEALAQLNGTPYGLSCSIWSKDSNKAQRLAEQADMGLVWINSWFLRNLNTPFGGMKRSGVGREGGQYSLDFFSEWKTISQPKNT